MISERLIEDRGDEEVEEEEEFHEAEEDKHKTSQESVGCTTSANTNGSVTNNSTTPTTTLTKTDTEESTKISNPISATATTTTTSKSSTTTPTPIPTPPPPSTQTPSTTNTHDSKPQTTTSPTPVAKNIDWAGIMLSSQKELEDTENSSKFITQPDVNNTHDYNSSVSKDSHEQQDKPTLDTICEKLDQVKLDQHSTVTTAKETSDSANVNPDVSDANITHSAKSDEQPTETPNQALVSEPRLSIQIDSDKDVSQGKEQSENVDESDKSNQIKSSEAQEDAKSKPDTDPTDENSSDDKQSDAVNNQESKNDEESTAVDAEEKKLDLDEDVKNPQYIPKKGVFYEHDDRSQELDSKKEPATNTSAKKDDDVTEVKESADNVKKPSTQENQTENRRGGRKQRAGNDRWDHDLYRDEKQKPKSKNELINSYGYDIRQERSGARNQNDNRHSRPNNNAINNGGQNFKNNGNSAGVSTDRQPQQLQQQQEGQATSRPSRDNRGLRHDQPLNRSRERRARRNNNNVISNINNTSNNNHNRNRNDNSKNHQAKRDVNNSRSNKTDTKDVRQESANGKQSFQPSDPKPPSAMRRDNQDGANMVRDRYNRNNNENRGRRQITKDRPLNNAVDNKLPPINMVMPPITNWSNRIVEDMIKEEASRKDSSPSRQQHLQQQSQTHILQQNSMSNNIAKTRPTDYWPKNQSNKTIYNDRSGRNIDDNRQQQQQQPQQQPYNSRRPYQDRDDSHKPTQFVNRNLYGDRFNQHHHDWRRTNHYNSYAKPNEYEPIKTQTFENSRLNQNSISSRSNFQDAREIINERRMQQQQLQQQQQQQQQQPQQQQPNQQPQQHQPQQQQQPQTQQHQQQTQPQSQQHHQQSQQQFQPSKIQSGTPGTEEQQRQIQQQQRQIQQQPQQPQHQQPQHPTQTQSHSQQQHSQHPQQHQSQQTQHQQHQLVQDHHQQHSLGPSSVVVSHSNTQTAQYYSPASSSRHPAAAAAALASAYHGYMPGGHSVMDTTRYHLTSQQLSDHGYMPTAGQPPANVAAASVMHQQGMYTNAPSAGGTVASSAYMAQSGSTLSPSSNISATGAAPPPPPIAPVPYLQHSQYPPPPYSNLYSQQQHNQAGAPQSGHGYPYWNYIQ